MAEKSRDQFEREIKLSLANEDDYRRLIAQLPQPHILLLQSNYFFDTSERLLGSTKQALRLRMELNADGTESAFLALKGAATQRDGVTIRSEQETEIDLESAISILRLKSIRLDQLGKLKDALRESPIKYLGMIASFTNRRIASTIEINQEKLIFEVDATTYSARTTEYELEIELSEDQAKNLEIFKSIISTLREWNISTTSQTRSKFERALARQN